MQVINTYSHLRFELSQVCSLLRDGNVVKLALLLSEKFEPALDRGLDQFGYAKGERAHEVVSRGPVPVPHLDEEPPVLVLSF